MAADGLEPRFKGRGSYLALRLFALPLEDRGMELNGALSNPFVNRKGPDLGGLAALVKTLTRGKQTPERPTAADKPLRLPRRQGAVLASVTTVLERADQPMRVRDIHQAVEHCIGEPVPQASVREALSAHTIRGDRRFRRIHRGCYESAHST